MTLVARGRHVRKGPVESSLVLCFYGVVHRTFYLIRIRQLGRGQGFGIEARRFLESRTELLQLKCCQRPIFALHGIEEPGVPYLDYDHEVT